MQEEHSKDKVFNAIFNSVIKLELEKGHLNWNYTILSKESNVSRTLIYYYFGKEKINILKDACLLFAQELSGVSEEREDFWEQGEIAKGLIKTKKIIKQCPLLVPFYLLYRNSEGEIGTIIRKHEQEVFDKSKKHFPHLSSEQIKIITSFHLGIISSNQLTDQDIKSACRAISSSFSLFPDKNQL